MVVCTVLMLWGLYLMMAQSNMIRQLIGMYIVQTSIIFLFVAMGAKAESTVPILFTHASAIDPTAYANPLPHMMMLTAIVVGVSTLGVALALVVSIHRRYRTIDERVIHEMGRGNG